MSITKILLAIMMLLFIAAVGHDIYMNIENQETFATFRLSEVGYILKSYAPAIFEYINTPIDFDFINYPMNFLKWLLKQKTIFVTGFIPLINALVVKTNRYLKTRNIKLDELAKGKKPYKYTRKK